MWWLTGVLNFRCVCLNTVFLYTCWWDWWRWRRWAGSRKGHSPIWTLCPPGPWGWDYRTGHWPDWCWLPSLLAVLSQTHCSSLLFHQAYAKTWDKENALIFGGTKIALALGFKKQGHQGCQGWLWFNWIGLIPGYCRLHGDDTEPRVAFTGV